MIASHDEKIFEFCDESYLLKDGVVTHLPQLAEKIKNGTDISELLRR